MRLFRRMRAIAIVLALAAVFATAFTAIPTGTPEASSCCIWVMVCTIDEPIICWEECIPCPPFPPPPWP